MTGTVLAQMIAYLISPLLTRIYSQEEMGDLGIYMRAIGFISALATARYELSLPLPKNDSHSYLLYRLSLRISIYMLAGCGLIGLIYLFFRSFDIYEIWFVIITLLSSAFLVIINLGTNWSIRKKQFKKISESRIYNSVLSNGLRYVFGLFGWGSYGLLLAGLIGFFASSFSFVKELFKLNKDYKPITSRSKMFVLSKQYSEFPQVSLPHALIDLGRDLLIAALIISFFSKDIFGSFSHSYTILRLPLVVIGASIGQVFFNRCAEMVNEGRAISGLLRKTLLILVALSIVPFGIIYFWGEPLFGFVFGSEWSESGYYSEIMAIWLMINFLNSPVSNIPLILKRQKEYFVLGLISTILQLTGFGILPLIWGTDKEAFVQILWFVSISQAIFLVIVTMMTLYYAKLGVKKAK